MRIKLFCAMFCLICCLLPFDYAFAQGVGSSGELRGTVKDPSGAVVPGATVTIANAEKGISRTVETDASGEYRIIGLPPASYDVTAKAGGFQTQVARGVAVTVGQTAIMDFELQVSAVASEVVVTSHAPLVETEKTHQANTIEETYIRNLPIDRRDYLTYALLMPGVADSNAFADNTDFRVVQTPQSGLSFYGSNGRGNSVTVDGAEANDDSGGVRLTLGQDAVQEFQVNRSNFTAELGGASGGVINIVSKSGTNRVHGSAFGFFRDDALDARNPLARDSALAPGELDPFPGGAPVQGGLLDPPSDRQQFGGTIGFPISQDKTFLFVSYEGLRKDESTPVPLLTDTSIFLPDSDPDLFDQTDVLGGLAALGATLVPCISNLADPTMPTILPGATCAFILSQILTTDPTNNAVNIPAGLEPGIALLSEPYLLNLFTRSSGVFPFSSDSDLLSVRLDHQFDDNDQLFFRYNYGNTEDRNTNIRALVGFSRGNFIDLLDNTAVLGWFHQFNPNMHNEARVMASYNESAYTPNQPLGPELNLPGSGFFNRDIFLPSFTTMRRYEFSDNFTYITGQHKIKLGGTVLIRNNTSESHTFFSGRFQFGELPGALLTPCFLPATTPDPNDPTRLINACGLATPATGLPINSIQSFKLGLPQFYQQGFLDPTVKSVNPFYAFYVQDTWNPTSNLTLSFGLRYELDERINTLGTDSDNFAPRFSFSWDPFGDHKTVIRGGYGIYYAPIYYQIDYVVRALGEVDPATGLPCRSELGESCFRQIPQIFSSILSPGANSAVIFQTLLAQGVIPCTNTAQEACITPANLTQFGISISQTGPLPPLSVRFSADPNYENPMAQQASLGVDREIAPDFSVSVNYIFSRTAHITRARDKNLLPATIDPVLGIPNWALPCPNTPTGTCFVNPLILQDNVYESTGNAFYHGGIVEVKKQFSNNFQFFANYTFSKAIDEVTDFNSDFQPFDQTNLRADRSLSAFDQRHKFVAAAVVSTRWINLSPILRANSGRPFNLLAGTNLNNDRHSSTDRPVINGVPVGRNTGRGPSFWTLDLRLSHDFKLNEDVGLEILAEGFNLFNRVNYGSVNNVIGTSNADLTSGVRVKGRLDRLPSQPLGFTSVFDPRRFQLGVRLTF